MAPLTTDGAQHSVKYSSSLASLLPLQRGRKVSERPGNEKHALLREKGLLGSDMMSWNAKASGTLKAQALLQPGGLWLFPPVLVPPTGRPEVQQDPHLSGSDPVLLLM